MTRDRPPDCEPRFRHRLLREGRTAPRQLAHGPCSSIAPLRLRSFCVQLNCYKIEYYPITTTAMLEADQRRLLGEFVRAHRERMRPSTAAGRRRTSGLRREELAALAGISVTWCAWIEQGRAVQASPEALRRISQALTLSRAERDYLFKLAGRLDPEGWRGAPRTRLPPLSPRSTRSSARLMASTRSGTPAAGTRPRLGSFVAGWTALASATCYAMCFSSLPPGCLFRNGKTELDGCLPNFARTSPAPFAMHRSGYSSIRFVAKARSSPRRGTSRLFKPAKAAFACSIILTTAR